MNKKEYIDFGVSPYALPDVLLALHNHRVRDFFITKEDDELHIRIDKDVLNRAVYPHTREVCVDNCSCEKGSD